MEDPKAFRKPSAEEIAENIVKDAESRKSRSAKASGEEIASARDERETETRAAADNPAPLSSALGLPTLLK